MDGKSAIEHSVHIIIKAPPNNRVNPTRRFAPRQTGAGVAALMSGPIIATISWAHFLAIDLFIGYWMYLDSRERNLTAWIVSPILGVAFMFSPIGFLFYLAARYISERRQ